MALAKLPRSFRVSGYLEIAWIQGVVRVGLG